MVSWVSTLVDRGHCWYQGIWRWSQRGWQEHFAQLELAKHLNWENMKMYGECHFSCLGDKGRWDHTLPHVEQAWGALAVKSGKSKIFVISICEKYSFNKHGEEFFLYGLVILLGFSQFTRWIYKWSFLLNDYGSHLVVRSIDREDEWCVVVGVFFIILKAVPVVWVQQKVLLPDSSYRGFSRYSCLGYMSWYVLTKPKKPNISLWLCGVSCSKMSEMHFFMAWGQQVPTNIQAHWFVGWPDTFEVVNSEAICFKTRQKFFKQNLVFFLGVAKDTNVIKVNSMT